MIEWRFVPGFEEHLVISNTGKVFSVRFEREIKKRITDKGYYRIQVTIGKKRRVFYVHRLVLLSFNPDTSDKPFVNHIDGNKLNNTLNNLEWCTPLENTRHAQRIGLLKKGSELGRAKLTELDALKIRVFFRKRHPKFGIRPLARAYGVDTKQIQHVLNNTRWKHV